MGASRAARPTAVLPPGDRPASIGRVVALPEQVHDVALHPARVLELVDEEGVDLLAHGARDLRSIAERVARGAEQIPEAERAHPALAGREAGPRVLEQGEEPRLPLAEPGRRPQERREGRRALPLRLPGERADEVVELVVRREPPAAGGHPPGQQIGEGGRRVVGEQDAGRRARERGRQRRRRVPEDRAPQRREAPRERQHPLGLRPRVGQVVGQRELPQRHPLLVEPIEQPLHLLPGRPHAPRRHDERPRRLRPIAALHQRRAERLVDRQIRERLRLLLVEDPGAGREAERERVPLHDPPRHPVERVDARRGPALQRVGRALPHLAGVEPLPQRLRARRERRAEQRLRLPVPRGELAQRPLHAGRDLRRRRARERRRDDPLRAERRRRRAIVALPHRREPEREHHVERGEPVRLAGARARGDDDVATERVDRRVGGEGLRVFGGFDHAARERRSGEGGRPALRPAAPARSRAAHAHENRHDPRNSPRARVDTPG